MNIDSFEHLEFETRPDQLLVYTLVQGDERVIVEFAPIGPGDVDASPFAPRQLEFDTSGYVQMELQGLDVRADDEPDLSPAFAADVRPPERGRRPDPLPGRLARPDDDRDDDQQVRQHLEEEGRRAAGQERVGEGRGSTWTPWMSMMKRRIAAEQQGPEGGPDRAPLGEDHEPDGDPAAPVGRSGRRTTPVRWRA